MPRFSSRAGDLNISSDDISKKIGTRFVSRVLTQKDRVRSIPLLPVEKFTFVFPNSGSVNHRSYFNEIVGRRRSQRESFCG